MGSNKWGPVNNIAVEEREMQPLDKTISPDQMGKN